MANNIPQVMPEKGFVHDLTEGRMTKRTIAFLCVYEVHCCYGGPEEGGWWYDAYDFMGAAFPFDAEQDFHASVLDHSDPNCVWDGPDYVDEDGREMVWVTDGLPRLLDEPTRTRLESAWHHFASIYGDPDAKPERYSVNGGADIAFVFELTPGDRGQRPRPRYC